MQSDEIWVLDFDRTLGSEMLYSHAESALERLSPEVRDHIIAARGKVEGEGGSFDLVSYLEEYDKILRNDFLSAFDEIVSSNDSDIYLSNGATDLLEYLRVENIRYMIMTYGGEVWQKAKLNAAGLGSAPHIIVDSKQKGDVISRWYQPNEKVFTVPFPDGSRMVAASICLVDDKAQAFTGMPEQARGYWVQSEELLESQRGEVPASVVPVSSLTDVVEKEKK